MPKIILNAHPHDLGWVRSVMLLPNDEALRNQNYAVEVEKFELETAKDLSKRWLSYKDKELEIPLKPQHIRLLIEAPADSELKSIRAEKTKQGIVAGQILSALYIMDKYKLDEPSMNKAVFCANAFAKKNKYGDGSSMHSETMIKEYWKEYISVSHLWAALIINQTFPVVFLQEDIFSEKGFLPFLQAAAGIYDFGSKFIPLRARPKIPVLNPEKCWVLDNHIGSRDLIPDAQPEILIKILKKYKTPKALPSLD